MVESEEYVATSLNFQVKNGEPIGTIYNVSLLPKGLAPCHSRAMHAIVVGHFRPPLGKEYSELPGRIAEALHFNLTTRLQTVHLPIELQPAFEPCDDARPRAIQFGKDLARALGAHAFLSGNISEEQPSFTVSTYVSDAYMVFATPMISTSRGVDLNDPGGAVMSGDTHVAVLAAVAAGLADKGDYRTAIAVIDAAAGLVDTPPRYIAELRRECESRVPQTGLLSSKRP